MSILWLLLLIWLMSNLLIYGFSIVIIFSKWILCSTCLLIFAFPFEMTFLPATKTSNFRFIKTQSRNMCI
ncbi:hypothetical protein HanPI659440_Chr05g0201631 [Helianthus annuus]|nr:hypothetical protein HanPI659440_Chr05g0201631 [Helianthus annuus]